MKQCLRSLQNAVIGNEDACKIIGRYDRRGVMFFLDPPYVGTDLSFYSGYTQEDFVRLLESLQELKGHFVMTSYANDALAAATEKLGWRRIDFSHYCSMGDTGNDDGGREEVITTNIPEGTGGLL